MCKQNIPIKILPSVSIEPRPLMNLWFQVQHSPFYTNWVFAFKTETLGSLYSHALFILTKSSKFKNQVVDEQKIKDLLSSQCPVNLERIVLDLESEVHWRPGFNTHWGKILLLDFFVFT